MGFIFVMGTFGKANVARVTSIWSYDYFFRISQKCRALVSQAEEYRTSELQALDLIPGLAKNDDSNFHGVHSSPIADHFIDGGLCAKTPLA